MTQMKVTGKVLAVNGLCFKEIIRKSDGKPVKIPQGSFILQLENGDFFNCESGFGWDEKWTQIKVGMSITVAIKLDPIVKVLPSV